MYSYTHAHTRTHTHTYTYTHRHTILKYSTKTVKFDITQIVCECEFVSWWLLDEKEQR
jgi:hypothetical protein